jgi:hypothetical protein
MLKATLDILYSRQVEVPGDRFVELRRWSVASGEHDELVLETGVLDEDDDLITTVQVLPGYLSLDEALAVAGVQSEPVIA